MSRSTLHLGEFLASLSVAARRLELTDTEWARRAGVRKETLSRLRNRETCDFATLRALAEVVGARVGLVDGSHAGHDGRTAISPRTWIAIMRTDCSSCALPGRSMSLSWAWLGPRFFMAGLAVMLASLESQDRRGLLALAENSIRARASPRSLRAGSPAAR